MHGWQWVIKDKSCLYYLRSKKNHRNASRLIHASETLSDFPFLAGLRLSVMPESWPTAGLWLDAPVLGFVHVAPVECLAANPSCICGLGCQIDSRCSPCPSAAAAFPTESKLMSECVHHSCGTSNTPVCHPTFAGFCRIPRFLDSRWENDYKTGLISKTHQSSHGRLPCTILYTNYLRHNIALMKTSCPRPLQRLHTAGAWTG